MTFFLIILIFIFIWYVLRPAYRVWSAVRKAQRQANDFFGQGQQSSYGNPFSGGGFAGGSQNRRRRYPRKKIDPNVGEYVEFEDLPSSPSSYDSQASTTTHIKVEQQVEDAEWEDIK